jgi:hypothetical protein
MSLVASGTGHRELEAERLRALIDKVGICTSYGEDGVRKATVDGKGKVTQKAVDKLGNRHFPREEVGADEAGQDVEGEGGPFCGTGAVNGEQPGTEESHEFIVADGAGGEEGGVVGERRSKGVKSREGWTEL